LEFLPFIVMFAHLDPTGDDPAAVLSSPGRSRELVWSVSCAGGHSGGGPAPYRLRPCALFRFLMRSTFGSAPDQIHQECLSGSPGYSSVHISLADLEVQQMNLVAELDIFRFAHRSCSPKGLCFVHFPAGCRFPSPCLACLFRGFSATAVEVPTLYRCGCACSCFRLIEARE